MTLNEYFYCSHLTNMGLLNKQKKKVIYLKMFIENKLFKKTLFRKLFKKIFFEHIRKNIKKCKTLQPEIYDSTRLA